MALCLCLATAGGLIAGEAVPEPAGSVVLAIDADTAQVGWPLNAEALQQQARQILAKAVYQQAEAPSDTVGGGLPPWERLLAFIDGLSGAAQAVIVALGSLLLLLFALQVAVLLRRIFRSAPVRDDEAHSTVARVDVIGPAGLAEHARQTLAKGDVPAAFRWAHRAVVRAWVLTLERTWDGTRTDREWAALPSGDERLDPVFDEAVERAEPHLYGQAEPSPKLVEQTLKDVRRLLPLVLLGVGLLAPSAASASERSAFHAGPWGTRAFVELLRGQGHEVLLWDEPLVGDLGKEAALVALLAPEESLSSEEVSALMAHLGRGGRLVYVIEAGGKGDGASPSLLNALGLGLAQGGSGAEAWLAASPIYGGAVPEGEVPVITPRRLRWLSEVAPTSHVLLADDGGMAAVLFQVGSGVAAVVVDLAPFANRWLGEGASAAFAVGLIASLTGERPVLLDVFHHGIVGDSSVASSIMASPWRWLLFQALLLAALWLWRVSQRQVAPPPAGPRVMPSATLQAEAVATLYHRAGADALAARALLTAFAQRARRRLALASSVGDVDVLRAACRRGGVEADALLEALDQAQRPGGAPAAAYLDRRLTILLRRIDDVAEPRG